MLGEILEAVGDLVGDAVGSAIAEPWNRRRRRRLQARGQIHAGLRVVHGSVPGLSSRWTHGGWAVDAGRLARHSTLVHVVRLDGPPCTPSFRESFAVDPDCAVFRGMTGQGEVEIAVLRDQVDWFLGRLDVARHERDSVG
ncbi:MULTISPECIES: hypothetical protein [unclassified Isoptericola]|uniref:hypothetical protein n=1 Tax=unclassified Isoptericola TaxID=2623355 RepID=UPI00364D39CA